MEGDQYQTHTRVTTKNMNIEKFSTQVPVLYISCTSEVNAEFQVTELATVQVQSSAA
jgi:hypothetical protein